MGLFGTLRFRGDVPKAPGFGIAWNMAAWERWMEQWEEPNVEITRLTDALVLGLAGFGLLRVTRGETGLLPEKGSGRRIGEQFFRPRVPAESSLQFPEGESAKSSSQRS